MVPRRRIVALDLDTPLDQVLAMVSQSPYSRLPVYRGSIDNIVGILRTKDLVRWFVEGSTERTLGDLVRPVPTVHESVTADRILRDLRERRSHQALVIDEFGGTEGLLTLADVLTELIGHVGDEFQPGRPTAERLGDGRMRLPGSMSVEEAASVLETRWDTEANTVGGMITAALGHLPVIHETVTIGTFDFEVERVADRAPQSVIVRRLLQETAEEAP
jgi:CBS domain containing-hemolysin-like protein